MSDIYKIIKVSIFFSDIYALAYLISYDSSDKGSVTAIYCDKIMLLKYCLKL